MTSCYIGHWSLQLAAVSRHQHLVSGPQKRSHASCPLPHMHPASLRASQHTHGHRQKHTWWAARPTSERRHSSVKAFEDSVTQQIQRHTYLTTRSAKVERRKWKAEGREKLWNCLQQKGKKWIQFQIKYELNMRLEEWDKLYWRFSRYFLLSRTINLKIVNVRYLFSRKVAGTRIGKIGSMHTHTKRKWYIPLLRLEMNWRQENWGTHNETTFRIPMKELLVIMPTMREIFSISCCHSCWWDRGYREQMTIISLCCCSTGPQWE